MNEESKEKLKLLQVVMSLRRKLGLCRVCYSDIPSLRFGTGFASPYNLWHGLLLKYSKLKINKKIIHVNFIRNIDERLIYPGHKKLSSSME